MSDSVVAPSAHTPAFERPLAALYHVLVASRSAAARRLLRPCPVIRQWHLSVLTNF